MKSESVNEMQAPAERKFLRRLADRTKPPRVWWYPIQSELQFKFDTLKAQHEACSKIINRVLFTLIGFSFFCLLVLGRPDSHLLGEGAEVQLPFAGVQISFASFLFIGPLILIGLVIYLHIFVGRWTKYAALTEEERIPSIFNMGERIPRLLARFFFYWLVPAMLGVFTWKALPKPESRLLILTTCMVTGCLVWLRIRRCPEGSRHSWNPLRWAFLLLLLVVSSLSTVVGYRLFSRQLYLFKAVLKDKDLRGYYMQDAYLVEANLSGANLSQANLEGAILTKADLTKADLSHVTLVNATLRGTNLSQTNLQNADLHRANLHGAIMREANLANANLRDADLKVSIVYGKTDLTRASLKDANLSNAALGGAILRKVDFTDANLKGANFEGVWETDLTGSKFQNADLTNANFRGTKLEGANLCEASTAFGAQFEKPVEERIKVDCPKLLAAPN